MVINTIIRKIEIHSVAIFIGIVFLPFLNTGFYPAASQALDLIFVQQTPIDKNGFLLITILIAMVCFMFISAIAIKAYAKRYTKPLEAFFNP